MLRCQGKMAEPPSKRARPTVSEPKRRSSRTRHPSSKIRQALGSDSSPTAAPTPELATVTPTTETSVTSDVLLDKVNKLASTVEALAGVVNTMLQKQPQEGSCHNLREADKQQHQVLSGDSDMCSSSPEICHQNPPPPSTSPQHSEYTSPIVPPCSTQRPVMLSSGVRAGMHLPDRIREKIMTSKYVEFYDIIFPETEQAYTMSMGNPNTGPVLSFIPRKRRQLTETEWCSAFDEYLSVYLVANPDHLGDILTYGRTIKAMMRNNQNWRFYDEQFRRDRELTLCSWASLRVDLQISAAQLSTSVSSPPNNGHSFRGNSPSNIGQIPKGYCFRYNTPGTRCLTTQCTFKHSCPSCLKPHPIYMCKSAHHLTRNNRPSSPTANRRQYSGRGDKTSNSSKPHKA